MIWSAANVAPRVDCVAGSPPKAASLLLFLGADDGTIDEEGRTCSSSIALNCCGNDDCKLRSFAKTS